jgi:hypothetical protein
LLHLSRGVAQYFSSSDWCIHPTSGEDGTRKQTLPNEELTLSILRNIDTDKTQKTLSHELGTRPEAFQKFDIKTDLEF